MNNYINEINFEKNLELFRNLNPELVNAEQLVKIKDDIEKIFNIYNKIRNLNKVELIETENNYYINDKNPNEIDYFLLAKMIHFNKKYFKFIPRKIQMLSVILFLTKEEEKGLVQQIDTGEGKSCIISFLAVYIALKKNKKIDILTSSPILAKRDALYFKQFYNSFDLTVDYSNDHNELTKKINKNFNQDSFKCYEADIVYGDALSFEGDILRTNFMGIMGRGKKRLFDCIIIDEIDNIALDNLKNTTELLDSFHGYKFLEYIYLFIYKKLKELTDGKKEIVEKKKEIIKRLIDECKKEFSNIKDLKKKNIYIPSHLEGYIHKRLDDWCESAYLAKFVYQNDENYIKRKDKEYQINVINPVDFYNTGVTQENSVWSGLHQFLQIREKQMLTEENLSSCFMSNLSFFNKYIKTEPNKNNNIIENNIYGLTGTIGSKYNKKTLKALYELDCIIIPPFRESKLIIEEPNIVLIKEEKNEKEHNNNKNNSNNKKESQQNYMEKWFKNIQNKIIEIVNKDRAVLVIFQYIKDAKKMYNIIKNKGVKFSDKLILYSRSDLNEDQFLEKDIKPGNIILSTNLSGRGTDIRISPKLNENGGLHVILTYEPFNQRIERQAFGRAGRKGENGSAGKIILSYKTKEEAEEEINKKEDEESNFLINVYKEKIKVFEKIFDKFSNFISEINERTHNELLSIDLKERWGIFLIKNSLNNIERDYKSKNKEITSNTFKEIEENYNKFEKDLTNYYYGFDLYLSKLGNAFSKTTNIVKSLIYNQEKYKFLNGLYLNKSDNINIIEEGINLYPELCLGGYMFIIIKKIENLFPKNIKELKNNFQKQKVNTIKKLFDLLNEKIVLLIKQFESYQEIINSLGYNKKYLDINLQNKQKIELMSEIKGLMMENKKEINIYEQSNYSMNIFVHKMSINSFIKNRNLEINKLVIEYFREYGLCLFKLTNKKKSEDDICIIC